MSKTREKLEDARRQEARLRAILETTVDGIVTISDRGLILNFNAAAERIFGYSAEEVIGENVNILMPEPHRTEHDNYIHRYLLTKAPHIIGIGREIEGRRKDGRLVPLYLAVSESNVDEARYFTGILRDISDLKRAEKKLQEANEALETFARTLAHDLRSPLTAMTGFADLIMSLYQDKLDHQGQDFVREILSNGEKMQMLIDDLLALARVGHIDRPDTPVVVNLLVDELITELLLEEGVGENALVRRGELPEVRISETLLLQIFQNLMANAVRYASVKDQPVVVSGQRYGDRVRFEVCDHGPGIPEEERERIFESFYRGQAGKAIPGSGIGLATVRKTARSYGGNAWVEETSGGGATFIVEMIDPLVPCGT